MTWKVEQIVEKTNWNMTRQEVFVVLGEPDDHNIGTRKYPRPTIYRYGEIELYFEYSADGCLYMIYKESEDHQSIDFILKRDLVL